MQYDQILEINIKNGFFYQLYLFNCVN